jgi:hypothetical protein
MGTGGSMGPSGANGTTPNSTSSTPGASSYGSSTYTGGPNGEKSVAPGR